MANPRFAWGIDIGNRALKAIKLVRDGDGIRVDDFDVIEHETVLSNSGDNRETLINTALTNFAQRHQIKGGAVAAGVSGQSSFARFIKLPPVEPKKIPEIVRFEAIQQIPFPLDDVEWSYQLFSAPESPDVEVGIFAMRKELINEHIKNFTDHDLNVQVVQMNPLAVYNAMTFDQRIDGTTMIIDMGAENTDLIIADADTIWLRSIPIGGNNFTETLVKSFKLNFSKAEDLKRNAATSKYARQIFQAMRPVFADLVAEVQRSIGFYASVHRDSRIQKIVAVGGAFKLPGLQKYLNQNLQLEVERLDTFTAGSPPDAKQAATYQDNTLSLVSAYGLALQAMGEGKITSSLLPARIRRERLWQEKTKFFGAAAALFVLGTGIAYGSIFLSNMSYEKASDYRAKIASVQSAAQGLDQQWTDISSKGGADRQRILNIRSLADYRDLQAEIIQDIHKTLPPEPTSMDELKKTPRNQRRLVLLDSVTNTYLSDLSQVGTDLAKFAGEQAGGVPSFGGGVGFGGAGSMQQGMDGVTPPDAAAAPTAPTDAAPATTGRGYVLRVAGTTPYTNAAALLDETLVKGLQAVAKEKIPTKKPFAIEKVQVVYLRPIKDDQARMTQMKTNFDAALHAKESGAFTPSPSSGGFGGLSRGGEEGMDGVGGGGGFGGFGGAAPGAVPGQVNADQAYRDRAFPDEDVREDHTFVAIVVVNLDPPPPTPPAEGGAPEAPAEPAAPAAPAASAQ